MQERSEGFKKIRKKQIPQTTGRKGLARMTEDMVKKYFFYNRILAEQSFLNYFLLQKKSSGKTEMPRVDVWIRAHTKKDGQPVNIQAGDTIVRISIYSIDMLVFIICS